MLISVDGYYRRGKVESLKEKVAEAIKGTKVKKILFVQRIEKKKLEGNYIDWDEIEKESKECKAEEMDSEDPLFILYTSGCCHGDSFVQLANGEIMKIKELVENGKKAEIINMDKNPLVQMRDNITYLHKYRNESLLYKVRTSSFECSFTPNHKLFSLDEYGNLIEKEASQLKLGDKVFVVSKINIEGTKQKMPLYKEKNKFRNRTTYRPKNVPEIPEYLTPDFAQIIGYLTGDGHIDNRSIIFTDKNKTNLIFYRELIKKTLSINGIIKKIERLRLHVNSIILTDYIKEFFSECIRKSKERGIPKILQRSDNVVVGHLLKGLFDAEGTVGSSFIKLSSTSEEIIRISQLMLRRLGIIAKVYHGKNRERRIRNRAIKETDYFDLIIYNRKSLIDFKDKVDFSDAAKKEKLSNLIEKLSSKRYISAERFPIFSLLKEITKIIKVGWKKEFYKITPYLYTNQPDKEVLILIKDFLDKKILELNIEEDKLERLRYIKNKVQKLIDFEDAFLEKILDIRTLDENPDFVYDLTAEKNHNYIVSGFVTHNTTGKPKGIVHVTGGYTVQAMQTAKLVFNINENDIMWCTADIGWITGHTYACYGPLLNGITTLIYEGSPDYPDFSRSWQIIEDNNVTIYYTAPTAIRMFKTYGESYVKKFKLEKLKVLGSVGEPIDETTWNWYFKNVGKGRCPIVDTWWQTETGGIMISSLASIGPFIPSFAARPFPSLKVEIVDEEGKEVKRGEKGNLVLMPPLLPGMLRVIWNDPEKYKEKYWSYKKFYLAGDGAYKNKDYIRITGRVDDVIKVAGHRLSTAEMEDAIHNVDEISENAVVSKPDEIKGELPIVFAKLKSGVKSSDELKEKLREKIIKTISEKIGPIAKPSEIYFVNDLPKTRSGKIMRRILKVLLRNEDVGEISTLFNPECVEVIKKILEVK